MKTFNAFINLFGANTVICAPECTAVNQTAANQFTKIFHTGALAFVRSIWLPAGSNHLIYTGVSPGQNVLSRAKCSCRNQINKICRHFNFTHINN